MSGEASFNDLFLIPPQSPSSSSCHMLAISTAGNQLAVISVLEEGGGGGDADAACPKVRILTGITSPQKVYGSLRACSPASNPTDLASQVCMVTRFKALILCGDRQLKLYDLDRGCLLLRLKGVMNQKMPFFACIDEKNCIALSRNRMTVNIMSLETGMSLHF